MLPPNPNDVRRARNSTATLGVRAAGSVAVGEGKIALVGEAEGSGDLASRYFTPKKAHPSYAVLGAICVASAAAIPESVASDVLQPSSKGNSETIIEHPAGTIEAGIVLTETEDEPDVTATVVRTARRLFAGHAFVPASMWGGP